MMDSLLGKLYSQWDATESFLLSFFIIHEFVFLTTYYTYSFKHSGQGHLVGAL